MSQNTNGSEHHVLTELGVNVYYIMKQIWRNADEKVNLTNMKTMV